MTILLRIPGKDHFLVSFDMSYSFTKIRTDQALTLSKKKSLDISENTTMKIDNFIKSIGLLNSPYFTCTALESPNSYTIANLVKGELENRVVSSPNFIPYFLLVNYNIFNYVFSLL